MSIFAKKPGAPEAAPITQVKGEADRDKSGPLPIGKESAAMMTRLSAEHERVAAGSNGCCVVICSADMMQGYTAEQAIAETAKRFANSLRAYDSVFMHGDDKVLVCLPFVKVGDAPSVMARLRDLAHRMPVSMADGTSGHITISVGGVMMDRTTTVPEILNRADKAMVQGRLAGNRACMWSPDML